MSEISALRPLYLDSVEKFRFGTTSFVLRSISNLGGANQAFINHLASIYDNLHILWQSPEKSFQSIRSFSLPVFDTSKISELERRHFEQDSDNFLSALSQIESGAQWEAAGHLLRSYYCLTNGSNLSAIIEFGNAILSLQRTEFPLTNGDRFVESIRDCGVSVTQLSETDKIKGLNFSIYYEFDPIRGWIDEKFGIKIYELQKQISPRFRFGLANDG
ncbi:MAG: hypothetical protein AAF296_05765 [Pseudomonadota bacterium]